jgi:NCS1 family nucleobase:cation symporter-1
VADYWIIRKRKLDLRSLYLKDGAYPAWNAAAVVATFGGCFLAWGGLVIPFLKPFYDYAWFVGFFAAGGIYVLLMRVKPLEAPAAG